MTFADGHAEYETLFLSTGTRARDLPLPGARLDGVFSLRKIDDVRALRGPMDAARHIVIVGGGYIGLEVAAVARGEGREVTVLEAEERVMKRVTSPVISHFMQDFHRNRGVDIRVGARLAAIEGGAKVVAGETCRTAPNCPPIWCCSRSAPGRTTISRPRRASPARMASWWTSTARPPTRRSGRRATAPVSPAGATAASCGSNACRTRSTRPRRSRPRSSASRKPTIRCRGSGRISTS